MKYLRVTMENGEIWDIPLTVIAADRAHYLFTNNKDEFSSQGDAFKRVMQEFEDDNFEADDWASNNMDWESVLPHAVRVGEPVLDYDYLWVNGDKELITK